MQPTEPAVSMTRFPNARPAAAIRATTLALVALAAAAVALTACDATTRHDDPALACDVVERGQLSFCVGRYWITETGFTCAPGSPSCHTITETGFACPDAMPHLLLQGSHFACSAEPGIPPELLDDVITSTNPDAACLSVRDPMGDADRDGLPNAVEDRNRNCLREPDETDALNSDTDGDGLRDGDEDFNRNGRYEPWFGEFDPLRVDSDSDGINDAQEYAAALCRPGGLLRPTVSHTPRVSLALPSGFVLRERGAARATFEDPARGAYGFVVEVPAQGGASLPTQHAALTRTMATSGHRPFVELQSAPFDAWSLDNWQHTWLMPPRESIASRFLFAYGPDSPNPATAATDPRTLRDSLFTTLGGSAPADSSPPPAPCDRLVARQFLSRHPDPLDGASTLLNVSVIACADLLAADPEIALFFEDVAGGTVVAPTAGGRSFQLGHPQCESHVVPATVGQLDVLWVIDNSGSMDDEQQAVANSTAFFLDTLLHAEVDWRIAVATTDAWLLDTPDPTPAPTVLDPFLDPHSGLRGAGFLGPDNAATEIVPLVTHWPGCHRAAPDANLCGYGLESGLSAGLTVLARTANDPRPNHRLREGAVPLVVWISDEDDYNFALPGEFDTFWDADDPRRELASRYLAARYASHGALACAIVGDAGTAQGGACTPRDPDLNTGADHGLGYLDTAIALGGVVGSICQPDLTNTLDACLRHAIARTTSYPLGRYPIASAMHVAVDGQLVTRGTHRGWTYEPATNALVFYGVELAHDAEITTAFHTWEVIAR